MTTNPCDKVILKAFKSLKDKAAFTAGLSKLRTEPAKNAFRTLHDMLSKEALPDVPVDHIEALLKGNLPEAAEFVFGKMEPKIATLSLDNVLRIASTPRCLQLWIGAASKKGGTEGIDKTVVVTERFRQSPQAAMQSVLAHWFVASAPAALFAESAALFIAKPDNRSFTSVEELLGHALRRDKDGKFTKHLLIECSKNREAFERTIAVIRDSTALFDEFVRVFVLASVGLPLDVLQATLKDLFEEAKLGWKNRDREFYRRLVSAAAAFLSVPNSDHTHTALAELDHLSAELQVSVPESILVQDACGIRYFGTLRQSSELRITPDGAKLVAIAISKVKTDTDPVLAMEATAFNLGMRAVEHEGANITFDPNCHEDIKGGALRGDNVLVVQTGWRLGDQLIQRVKVKPN